MKESLEAEKLALRRATGKRARADAGAGAGKQQSGEEQSGNGGGGGWSLGGNAKVVPVVGGSAATAAP